MPGGVFVTAANGVPVKPSQVIPLTPAPEGTCLVVVVAGADGGLDETVTPGRASIGGRGFGQLLPIGAEGVGRGSPVVIAGVNGLVAVITRSGVPLRRLPGGTRGAGETSGVRVFARTKQIARRLATSDQGRVGNRADANPFDPLNPPPFLLRKLKNAVNADPGNAGFPVGQPALLRCDKAAENAAFPGIDGVIPLVAVFAGGPGFGLAKGVGLVDAAVEGLAPVFGQGFQDGGRAVGVGKGLPIGTVPGDRTGLGRWIPPPLRKMPLERQGRPLHCVGTWLFPPVWG